MLGYQLDRFVERLQSSMTRSTLEEEKQIMLDSDDWDTGRSTAGLRKR